MGKSKRTLRRGSLRALGVAGIALAFALASATVAQAQVRDRDKVDRALTAKITVIDPDQRILTLVASSGLRTLVGVDDRTTLMNGADRIAFGDLRANEWVVVDAVWEGHCLFATYVEVVDERLPSETKPAE